MTSVLFESAKKTVLDERSIFLRSLVVTALEGGKRGHIGSSMSLIEILRVLYDTVMKYDANNTAWPDRDRFILSKGHGCLALYALLADKHFISKDELKQFCHFNSLLGGHPESKIPGVEVSTGSLGHGLSIAVGMAIAAKMQQKQHRVFVVMGDGELNEGSVWEGALCAAKHNLDNLVVIIDRNHMQSFGDSDHILNLEPLRDKWESFGFSVSEVNGHAVADIENQLITIPFQSNKPSLLICHTVKGKGIQMAENVASWHHKASLSEDDIKKLHEELNRK